MFGGNGGKQCVFVGQSTNSADGSELAIYTFLKIGNP